MLSQLFAPLQPKPDDPILGLNELFKNAPRPNKVNLGVGVYLTEEGKVPLLKCVGEAERRLLERGAPHTYQPMSGLPSYTAAIKRLVFGPDIDLSRIATIHTLGGTGGLNVGSLFANQYLGMTKAVVPNPTWSNHIALFKASGFEVGKYRYYDFETASGLDVDGMVKDLEGLEEKTLVLLHACCQNPSGYDLTDEEWDRIFAVLKERNLFPFLDMAYQGFGIGIEEDARIVRRFAREGFSFVVASSCSKNFSLYGERVGGLHVVTQSAGEAEVVMSILKSLVRAEYSNPPLHGAAVVSEVLNDPELQASWREEVKEFHDRIAAMRTALDEAGKAVGVDLSFAVRQCGMFSFTGFTREEMIRLREEFGVYGVENGRICVAGLNTRNVGYVADAFAKILSARG